MALNSRDHRFFHVPRQHLESETVFEVLLPLQRIMPPCLDVVASDDVVPDAEAASLRAQQNDACGGVGLGGAHVLDEREPELLVDGVQFLRPVERDDRDAFIVLAQNELAHRAWFLARFAGTTSPSMMLQPFEALKILTGLKSIPSRSSRLAQAS